MNIESLVIVAVLLLILAEVTYLVAKLPRQISAKKRMIFVDTSVLIDGRIIAVAKSGFIRDTLVVPRSVIGELQFLADHADHDKRARARYGLDVVRDLQEMPEVDVHLLQDGSKAAEGVDERLLNLAKKYNGVVCTIDFNLNKVATVEGITVLNVNELAQSLRMAYLPGERMLLEMVQKGQDSHQAVGYLPDGTMVVVEHAFKQIGQTIEIEFIRSLQTAAGKMMFAKRVEAKVPTKETKLDAALKQKKPSGRAPRKQAEAVKKQPEISESVNTQVELPKPSAVVTEASTVYHSDSRDQKRVERRERTPVRRTNRAVAETKNQDATPEKKQAPRRQQQPTQQKRVAKPRPKTSAQREAALIDLVENQ